MQTWSSLQKSQPKATKILMNSLRKNRISHAYLFQGAKGTGKKTLAQTFIKSLFCTNRQDLEPCHLCQACRRIESTNHPDVHYIQPDGATIRIEQIRYLQKEFSYSSMESGWKAYIIDGADTLTVNASNRILKFLEEPNKQTVAILLTQNRQAILPTIRSRCQMIDLLPLDPTDLQEKLEENGIKKASARLLSMLTNDLEEAIRLYKEEELSEKRQLTIRWLQILAKHPEELFLFIHQRWLNHFKERTDLQLGFDLLLLGLKDLLYELFNEKNRVVLLTTDENERSQMSLRLSKETLLHYLNLILFAKKELKQNVHPTLTVEKLVLQMQKQR